MSVAGAGSALPAPPLCPSRSAIKPVAKSPGPGEALPAGEWETVQLRGSWRIGRTAGGSRNFASYPTNPCFPLAVPDGAGPRCVRITLRQHCQDSQCRPIGFHVFQASSSRSRMGVCPHRCPGSPERRGLGRGAQLGWPVACRIWFLVSWSHEVCDSLGS